MDSNVDRMNTDRSLKDHYCRTSCFSWTAVIVGALVGLGLGFLLNLLGSALGMSAFTATKDGIMTLVATGFIGMVIGVMIVTYIMGWISGYLGSATCESRFLGVLYGFTAWSLSLFLTMILASTAGSYINEEFEQFTTPHASIMKMTSKSVVGTREGKAAPTSVADAAAKVSATDEKAINLLGKTMLMFFIVFIVGAVTASFGGLVGMRAGTMCNRHGICFGDKDRTDRKRV